MTASTRPRLALFAAAVLVFVWLQDARPRTQDRPGSWFKGNLHTHTLNSDGDSTPDDVQRTRLFEVFNGHPLVNNLGGGVPGLEEVWDRVLSSGKMLYGIAVDDAHYVKRPEDKTAPRPGQGWVYVRATRLESRALVAWVQPVPVGASAPK